MQAFRIGVLAWWASVGTTGHPAESGLPASVRRRATPLGRRALAAGWSLNPDTQTRFIFSSRHGEYSRTFAILQALAAEDGVSPAEFSMSVHHALAGLMSIATGNDRGHIALASGGDTFGHGLIEAAACLAEAPEEPVMLVHYDEPLPDIYTEFVETPGSIVALLLQAPGVSADALEVAVNRKTATERADDLGYAFATFLHSHEDMAVANGERLTWRWRHV